MITALLLVLDRSGCQAVEYNWRPTSKCEPLSSSLFDGGLLMQQRMNKFRRCECKKLLIKKITSTWVKSFIPFFFLSPPGMSLKPTAGPQPWPNFSCFMPYLLLEQQGGIRWCVSPGTSRGQDRGILGKAWAALYCIASPIPSTYINYCEYFRWLWYQNLY